MTDPKNAPENTPETSGHSPETAPEAKDGWFHLDIHPQVFFFSAALVILFVAGTIIFQAYVGDAFTKLQSAISQ